MSTTESNPTTPATPIVAGPGRGYRIKFGIFAILMIAMGGWFGYDGFIGWPAMNEKLAALKAEREKADAKRSAELLAEIKKLNNGEPRTDKDIAIQKLLCFALPPLGLFLAIRAFRNSRGEYRLENDVLTVPGHPPVPLVNITEIDRRLWDRKGIAYINYDLGEGKQGTLRLDDYFHDRPPTDEIFKRVEEFVGGAAEPTSEPDNKEAHG